MTQSCLYRERVAVEDEEVGVVLLRHQLAQLPLQLRGQVPLGVRLLVQKGRESEPGRNRKDSACWLGLDVTMTGHQTICASGLCCGSGILDISTMSVLR